MTMIKVDNDISQDRLQKTIDALDPQKPTVIWYGISAAHADTNYFRDCQVINDEVLKIKSIEDKTQKLDAARALKESIVDLYTNVFETEHYQHGAHLESFIGSMGELHDRMKASNQQLASFIFYDTSTLHRYNRNWVRGLTTPETLATQEQILQRERNKKTLENFGISYEDAYRLLTTSGLHEGISVTFKDPISGTAKEKTFYLFGSSWEKAYEILEKAYNQATDANNAAKIARLRDTPFLVGASEGWLLLEIKKRKKWYKEAAELFEEYQLFDGRWKDAYYLLRDSTIAAFPKDVLEQYELDAWEELETSQMEGIITDSPKCLSDRFGEWKNWYTKTSALFQSTIDDNDPNDSDDSKKSRKSRKSHQSKQSSLIIAKPKKVDEFTQALKNVKRKLNKIAREAAWEATSNATITTSLQDAAEAAYERFGKTWQDNHKLSIMENTKSLQTTGVKVALQAWKNWYQSEKGKEYINKIESHYHNNPAFRKVVNNAALARLKKVTREDQQRNSTRHPVKTPDRKKPAHTTIGKIDFTNIFCLEGIQYILEEVARVWCLLEEYPDCNILLTYPNWNPPDAVTYFLSSQGLLNNLNPKRTNSVPLEEHHITYLGFSYLKPPSVPERKALATKLAARLANLKQLEVVDKGKNKADTPDTTSTIVASQEPAIKQKQSKTPLPLLSPSPAIPVGNSEIETLRQKVTELSASHQTLEQRLQGIENTLEKMLQQTLLGFKRSLEQGLLEVQQTQLDIKMQQEASQEALAAQQKASNAVLRELLANQHSNSRVQSSSQEHQSKRVTEDALVESVKRMLGPDATQEDVNGMLLNMPTAHNLYTAAPNTSSSQRHHIPYPSQLTPNATAGNTAARNTPTSPSYNMRLPLRISNSPAPVETTRAHAEAQGRTSYLPGTKHPAPPPITIPRRTPEIKIEGEEGDRDFYGLTSPGKRKTSPAFFGSFFGNKRRKESQQYQRDTNMSGLESDGMTVTGSSSGQASPSMKPKR